MLTDAAGSKDDRVNDVALKSATRGLRQLAVLCDSIVESIERRDFNKLADKIHECIKLFQMLRVCASKMKESPVPVDALRHLFTSEASLQSWLDGRIEKHKATNQELQTVA